MSTSANAPATASDQILRPEASPTVRGLVGALAVGLLVLALVGPNLAEGASSMGHGMSMTHYMELLSLHQPWNLLLFMAVPVVLAETLAITEIALLFQPRLPGWVRQLQRIAGLLAGPVMLAILAHLLVHAVVPLTTSGGWRGPLDVIAVLCYLLGALPMIGITLVELGLLGSTPRDAGRLRAIFIAAFLIVAHIAMIVGMLSPDTPPAAAPVAPATTPSEHHHR